MSGSKMGESVRERRLISLIEWDYMRAIDTLLKEPLKVEDL